ncbi:MAG: DUF3108 domain-containing protein [Acidobacteria bacterium]|nr:DUF3108 domain-containing protein [Acidobacteriota bacterium]
MMNLSVSNLLRLTAFMAVVAVSASNAQTNGTKATADVRPVDAAGTVKTPRAVPFSVGEQLTYEGKLSKIISGISIAELTFTVGEVAETNDYLISAEARSKGTLLKIFRFSFLQKIDSTVDRDEFFAEKTVKVDVQKERVRNSEALFDYDDRRVTYVETDPKDPMRPPRTIASELAGETHDLISGIYQLRLLPLKVGDKYDITVSDSGLVYTVPVTVTGREQQKTAIGKVWCVKVEPDVFGEGKMIERDGSMTIWITDDVRRIPVRSVIQSPYGKIEVKIKSARNIAKQS